MGVPAEAALGTYAEDLTQQYAAEYAGTLEGYVSLHLTFVSTTLL